MSSFDVVVWILLENLDLMAFNNYQVTDSPLLLGKILEKVETMQLQGVLKETDYLDQVWRTFCITDLTEL